MISRKNMVECIIWRKESESLKVSSSKSRVRTKSHTGFHLFERTLVVAACLVGRKERM